jgi:hypothetical protein
MGFLHTVSSYGTMTALLQVLTFIFLLTSQVAGQGTFSSGSTSGRTFTIVDGQVLTPGLAIVDAPQPNTPEGGGLFP